MCCWIWIYFSIKTLTGSCKMLWASRVCDSNGKIPDLLRGAALPWQQHMCGTKDKPRLDLVGNFVFHSIILQVPQPVGTVVLISSLGAVFIEAMYCYFAQCKTIKYFCGLCLQIPFGLIHLVWFRFARNKCREAFRCIAEHVQNNSVWRAWTASVSTVCCMNNVQSLQP